MAITNFFAHLAAIPFEGCVSMTVRKDGEQMTVSVLLTNEACGDTAKAHIPPLLLKGSPKQLCEGFFPAISEPIAESSALLLNMEAFLKGQEAAKQHAAMEQKKTEKAGTPTKAAPSKYESLMATVDALEAAGKFREAWVKVPQPSDFPDKAEELRERRKNLSAKFSPDLFEMRQPAAIEVEPNTENDATDNCDAEGLYDAGEGQ